ncbi:GNAT family N-acetyltransferase [Streptococcus dentasini]
MRIRPIEPDDNAAVAALIRDSLQTCGLDKPGTAYDDPQLDDLAGYYDRVKSSAYFVLENDGEIVGCGGFGPLFKQTAELQKLYLAADYRGRGLASQLVERIETAARTLRYERIYLETSSLLDQAVAVYEHLGYSQLASPLQADSPHTAMDIWMVKSLAKEV